MEDAREITIKFSFTRRHALFALAFFFIVWHPGFIGSETLTLTTYYPAPYGGYVTLLTTGQTLLARDMGRVGINTGTTIVPRAPLDVRGEVIAMSRFTMTRDASSTSPTWHIDNSADRFRIFRQPNLTTPGAEFVSVNSAGNMGIAYGPLAAAERLHINGNLRIDGDGSTTGFLKGLCVTQPYSASGTTSCPAGGYRVFAHTGDGVARVTGYLPQIGGDMAAAGTYIVLGEDWGGVMVCCRIVY